VTKQKKRRVWSAEEKRLVCGQARLPGVSVSQVARRYDVNANLVFTWLRDPRFADGGGGGEVASFLPVEIVRAPELAAAPTPGDGRIEIELAGGHRLRIVGSYDPEALARLLRGLSA
jgi:transposase